MGLSLEESSELKKRIELLNGYEYDDVFRLIRERKYSSKDLGISYRELYHWSTQEILLEDNYVGKWRRFNTIELVWLEIVKELRKYNIGIKAIRQVRELFEVEMTNKDLIDGYGRDKFEEAALEVLKIRMSEEEYEEIIKSDIYQEMFKGDVLDIPPDQLTVNIFELVLVDSYFFKCQWSITLNADGDAVFFCENNKEDARRLEYFDELFGKSCLTISINKILANIFKDYQIEELALKWKLIDQQEEKILNILEDKKNIKSIHIKYTADSKLQSFEITEELKITMDDYLKKMIIAGSYQEIKILTQKGSIVHCERTTKHKL